MCLDLHITQNYLDTGIHVACISVRLCIYTHIYADSIDFLVYLEVPKVDLLSKALIPILRLIIRYKEKKETGLVFRSCSKCLLIGCL